MHPSLVNALIAPSAPISEAIFKLDTNRKGIVLIVDDDSKLVGTITDGDIRRALLAGESFDSPVSVLFAYKSENYQQPVTATESAGSEQLLILMRERYVRQIPIVNAHNQVLRLVTIEELSADEELPVTAVIMAGGFGSRLRPLTDNTPKPLLPLGDRPILEWIILSIRNAGMREIIITTHYLGEQIHAHCGDGSKFGVNISYIDEDKLSGTAGPLGLLSRWERDYLVINGDILTQVDFRALYDYHRAHSGDMTVGLRNYKFQVPYGVAEIDGVRITAITEKPSLDFFVNAGIYILSPIVREFISKGEYLDMPDLIKRLMMAEKRVIGFPIREYWLDIGQHAQYEQAMRDIIKWEY